MSLHAVNIQGIKVTKSSKKEILKDLEKFLFDGAWEGKNWPKNGPKMLNIVTPNPEQIVLAHDSHKFADLLNQADVALPDGVGLVWASRFLAKKQHKQSNDTLSGTIPGLDFMEDLVAIAADRHVPIALIGGSTGVAVKTLECLRQSHPDLHGVAMDAPDFTFGPSGLSMNGSIDEYFKTLALELKSKRIGMVFVALGAPKQEYFIDLLAEKLKIENYKLKIVLMSVGGSFDEISGRIPRAPDWVSRVGLKWLWRLILEPWRIKRQLALLKFICLALLDWLSGRSR